MRFNDINNLFYRNKRFDVSSVLNQYLWSIVDICLRTILVLLLSLFVLLDSQPYESVLESINKSIIHFNSNV